MKILKILKVYILSVGLTSISSITLANRTADGRNQSAITTLQLLNTGGRIATQYAQQISQIDQQVNFANINNPANLLITSSTNPAPKFFPECTMANPDPPFEEGACSQPSPNLQDARQFFLEAGAAFQKADLYDKMIDGSQPSKSPIGLKCYEDKIAALNQAEKTFAQQIEDLKRQLAEQYRRMKNTQQDILDQMDITNRELEGGSPGDKPNDEKSRSFADYFADSAACKNVLPSTSLDDRDRAFAGLRGIQSNVFNKASGGDRSFRQKASDLRANESKIKAQIDIQVSRIADEINSKTLASFLTDPNMSNITDQLTQFGSLEQRILKKNKDFADRFNTIRSEIKRDIGFDVPNLDSNFKSKINKFLATRNDGNGRVSTVAEDFMRKKFITDCVFRKDDLIDTNQESSDFLGIRLPDLLKTLKLKDVNRRNNNLSNFKDSLTELFKEDRQFDESFLARIRELEKTSGGQVIFTPDRNSGPFEQGRDYTVSDALNRVANNCKAQYNKDYASSRINTNGLSQKELVDNSVKKLRELKNLEKNFLSDLTADITEGILTCSTSSAAQLQGSSCNADTLSPTSASFCLENAKSCANDVSSCYKKVNEMIKSREANINRLGATFNQNMSVLENQAKSILANLEQRVRSFVALRDNIFLGLEKGSTPGSNKDNARSIDNILASLSPNFGNPEKTKYGIKLLGGGSLDLLDPDSQDPNSVFQSLSALQEYRKNETQKIQNIVGNYMREQQSAFQKYAALFEKQGKRCLRIANESQNAFAQMQQDAYEKQQAAFGESNAVCNIYKTLPKADLVNICDNYIESLVDSSNKATLATSGPNALTVDTRENIVKLQNLCSIRDSLEKAEDDQDDVNAFELCDDDEDDSLKRKLAKLYKKAHDQSDSDKNLSVQTIIKMMDGEEEKKEGDNYSKINEMLEDYQKLVNASQDSYKEIQKDKQQILGTDPIDEFKALKDQLVIDLKKLNSDKSSITYEFAEKISAQDEFTANDIKEIKKNLENHTKDDQLRGTRSEIKKIADSLDSYMQNNERFPASEPSSVGICEAFQARKKVAKIKKCSKASDSTTCENSFDDDKAKEDSDVKKLAKNIKGTVIKALANNSEDLNKIASRIGEDIAEGPCINNDENNFSGKLGFSSEIADIIKDSGAFGRDK